MKNKHCDFNTFLFCTQIKFTMKKRVLTIQLFIIHTCVSNFLEVKQAITINHPACHKSYQEAAIQGPNTVGIEFNSLGKISPCYGHIVRVSHGVFDLQRKIVKNVWI